MKLKCMCFKFYFTYFKERPFFSALSCPFSMANILCGGLVDKIREQTDTGKRSDSK